MTKSSKPRILLWDIETTHNIVMSFDLYPKYINPENILQEKYIICGAWKWADKSKIYAVSVADEGGINDDYNVVAKLHEVVASADAIVAHYGDNFDIKVLNARMVKHGFGPLPPVIQIDTYKIAKARFKFNSNKLDYLAQYLGFEGKATTPRGLWHRCLQGDKKAIREMVAYNKQDIVVLESVYKALKPFVPAKVNERLFSTRAVCSSCGSDYINYRGYAYTRQRKYHRYQCLACGHWDRERTSVK